MDALISFDKELLLFLNSFYNHFFDLFFWTFTSIIYWIPLYIVILYTIFKNQGKQGFVTLGIIILLIVLCDQISTNILKEGIQRLRPSHDLGLKDIIHLVNNKRGGKYGFVSSHATNSFGLAIFTALLFRHKTYSFVIVSWALLNSYSRIYLGVHFPGDIIGGALLGASLAFACYQLYLMVIPRFILIPHANKSILAKEIGLKIDRKSIHLLIYTIALLIIALIINAKCSMKFLI